MAMEVTPRPEQEGTLERFGTVKLGRNTTPYEIAPAMKTNCRNCGAPHDGFKCGYCGTNYNSNPTYQITHNFPGDRGFNFGALYSDTIERKTVNERIKMAFQHIHNGK